MDPEDTARQELLADEQPEQQLEDRHKMSPSLLLFTFCLCVTLLVLSLYAVINDNSYPSLRLVGYLLVAVHSENLLEVVVRITPWISMRAKLLMEVCGFIFTFSVYTYAQVAYFGYQCSDFEGGGILSLCGWIRVEIIIFYVCIFLGALLAGVAWILQKRKPVD